MKVWETYQELKSRGESERRSALGTTLAKEYLKKNGGRVEEEMSQTRSGAVEGKLEKSKNHDLHTDKGLVVSVLKSGIGASRDI